MITKLTLATLFISTSIFAQTEPTVRTCGTMEHMEYLKQQNPGLEQELKEYNQTLDQWIAQHPQGSQSRAIRTIPIVFHIVYNTTAQNISDEQILSQLKAVNEDFSRTNADASQTPAGFKSIAGNPNIQFCMAQRDPSGKATNGIVRVKTANSTGFTDDDAVKFTSQGGSDAWDVTKYYNIWVCNFEDSKLLGYGEFPKATASKTFGYVGTYKYTGTTSNVKPPFNKGRTTTHEMGHCFNLYHIWGDDEGACTGSDQCADTPNQADASSGKPTYPLIDACATKSPGAMFMNYMDYSDDDAMNMFTVGQVARMDAVINNAPYNKLLTSNGCSSITGIDVLENNYELNIYPNPNDGNFTLTFNGVEKSDYQIELKNALGQSVYTEAINGFSGNYSKALNLQKYGKGIYTISISSSKNQAVKKMIVY